MPTSRLWEVLFWFIAVLEGLVAVFRLIDTQYREAWEALGQAAMAGLVLCYIRELREKEAD